MFCKIKIWLIPIFSFIQYWFPTNIYLFYRQNRHNKINLIYQFFISFKLIPRCVFRYAHVYKHFVRKVKSINIICYFIFLKLILGRLNLIYNQPSFLGPAWWYLIIIIITVYLICVYFPIFQGPLMIKTVIFKA